MMGKIKKIHEIFNIPRRKLKNPGILFTLDSSEPKYEKEIKPLFEVFAEHGIPLTLFICNQTLTGEDNYAVIFDIIELAEKYRISLELASHAINHERLAEMPIRDVMEVIGKSIFDFKKQGIPMCGFRSPYLSTEDQYREVLLAMKQHPADLKYDSSIFFESNLFTSIFHGLTLKKRPHKVGDIWELPISSLDDYHLIKKLKYSERFAYAYWVIEANLWIRSTGYFMLLFHPHIMIHHLKVMNRFLSYCSSRFPLDYFKTCTELIADLDASILNFNAR